MVVLKPRQPVPELALQTLGDNWTLSKQSPENFTLVVFYRGMHCPICKTYLQELNRLSSDFSEKGISLIAVSSDTRERAATTAEEWKLDNLTLGWGLTVEQARAWGLHRSAGRGKTSIGIEEPAEFSEPGIFMIRPDGTLYWASISTMPFARPHFREMLGAADFILNNDYPARGELS